MYHTDMYITKNATKFLAVALSTRLDTSKAHNK